MLGDGRQGRALPSCASEGEQQTVGQVLLQGQLTDYIMLILCTESPRIRRFQVFGAANVLASDGSRANKQRTDDEMTRSNY